MTVTILQGDCRVLMDAMEPGIFNACITSPPYWGLRDYGTQPLDWPAMSYVPMAGLPPIEVPAMTCAYGLEPTVEAFIGHGVLVFRGVRRVLRDDGTCWVNMGDSYAGARRGGSLGDTETLEPAGCEHQGFTQAQKLSSLKGVRGMTASRRRDDEPVPRSDVIVPGLKSKDMIGQPWRLAFALQADGWWLRMDVIWAKKNPMPESAKDRPTKAHEYVFLLAKSERYYFDHDAIKEEASEETHARYARGRSKEHKHAGIALVPGGSEQTIAQSFEHMRKPVAGWASGAGDHSVLTHAAPGEGRQGKLLPVGQERLADFRDRQRKLAKAGSGTKNNDSFDAAMAVMPEKRAKRSVWPLATEAMPDAHFATFPTALVEPCILAGCPLGGTVLDPFGGAATTGVVADRLGRHAVLCELNPEYVGIGERRLAGDRGHVARQIQLEAAA